MFLELASFKFPPALGSSGGGKERRAAMKLREKKKSIFGSKEIAVAGILVVIEPLTNHMRFVGESGLGIPRQFYLGCFGFWMSTYLILV